MSEGHPHQQGVKKLSDSFCASDYAASLRCLDAADYDKSKCQDQFAIYKECKKKEKQARLEANKKKQSFW
eukprot:jgi/Mesen1/9293/ME000060S08724